MGILSFLGGAIKPIAGLVDDLHTSTEEKLQLKVALDTLHNQFASKALDYEQSIMEAKTSIIVAEAKSPLWITAAWRPTVMLTFTALIVYSQFTQIDLPPDLWTVIKIGLGGYVGGRSAEKIVPGVMAAMKEKDKV